MTHVHKTSSGSSTIYPYLNGGQFKESSFPDSPDPLVNYQWASSLVETAGLQSYNLNFREVKSFHKNLQYIPQNELNPSTLTVLGNGSMCFDFGVVSAGWLEFDCQEADVEVIGSISEYNRPAVVNEGAEVAVKRGLFRNENGVWRLKLNRNYYEGVRFGWIEIRNFKKQFVIKNFRLACQVRPINYQAKFRCSDEVVSRVWWTGAYSVKLNLLPDMIGAILMERSDRHSWTGDAFISQGVALAAFGAELDVLRNLERTAKDSNGIASYALYWILGVCEWYLWSGKGNVFDGFVGQMMEKIRHGLEIFREPQQLVFIGHDERLSACFEDPDRSEAKWNYRMLFLWTCRELISCLKMGNHVDFASEVEEIRDTSLNLLSQFKDWSDDIGLHAAADGVSAEVLNGEAIFNKWFSDPANRISYSPFNQDFILRAMAKLRRHDEALNVIRTCWGGQLELGATTFWESYRPSWNNFMKPCDVPPNGLHGFTSLCHPWSSGVVRWLTQEILGLKATSPGWKSFIFEPAWESGLEWAEGSQPTPHGEIKASWDRTRNQAVLTVPEGTSAFVRNTKEELTRSLEPGTHHLEWHRKMPTNMFSTPHLIIEHSSTKIQLVDCITQGNWRNKYGKEGYALFNYDGPERSRLRLPHWIEAVKWGGDLNNPIRNMMYCAYTDDVRALESPESCVTHRQVGCLMTANPLPCHQTIAFDILLKQRKKFQLALYCLDWDRLDREMVLEIFDFKSRDLIVPTHKIENFSEGQWIIIEAENSLRLRLCSIWKHDAVVSGLFFD
jgi:alpha-L-rhamnosidase